MVERPYIFAHRGGMGLCIENTIPCFKSAVNLGVGIETDVQLTKDKVLVCFHDYFIGTGKNRINISSLTLEELKLIKFGDDRVIPTAEDLFTTFDRVKKSFNYSFDIRGSQSGIKLISLAKKYDIIDRIEICERSLTTLKKLRGYNKEISLIHTLPDNIIKINRNSVDFQHLKDMGINKININVRRAKLDNFLNIIENEFNCYIWNVNTRARMKKVLSLEYEGTRVKAIYTDYPDILIDFLDDESFDEYKE